MRLRFLPVLALALLFCGGAGAAQVRDARITILHTNDTHGHLLPFSFPETYDPGSDLAQLAARRDIGGAARRATLIKGYRKKLGKNLLVIDSGDLCDGTPFSTEYHGEADVATLNAMGYDLGCPGNHEFNQPLDKVRRLKALTKFPLLCANMTDKASGKPLYLSSIIREIGGARIAFFGLMTYSARTYPGAREAIRMEEPRETARRIVPELRKRADLVVAVTHIGVEEDVRLAREVPGIDVIVGGHSHTLIPSPRYVLPQTAGTAAGARGTIIVQDYQYGATLGKLDLELQRDGGGSWRVAKYEGCLLPVTRDIPEDGEVARIVSRYWKPISSRYGEALAEAAGDFAKKGPDSAEYHLVADAIREEMGVDFDLENAGGVRAYLARGPITLGDVTTMDPFGNTVVTFEVTGKLLKRILEERRPAVSGIRYVLDRGKLAEATINGKPIDDERVYRGATNSYFANTPVVRDITNRIDTKQPRLERFIAWLRKKKVVSPAYDGRRILRNTPGDPLA